MEEKCNCEDALMNFQFAYSSLNFEISLALNESTSTLHLLVQYIEHHSFRSRLSCH